MSSLLSIPVPPYNWADFRSDYAEELWFLYHNILTSIKASSVTLLDNLSYHQFVDFCVKHTSKPVEPPDKYHLTDDDIESQTEQQQHENDDNDIEHS